MTLDATIPIQPPALPVQYGIPVTVFVSDQALRTEVWRAPDASGSPNDGAAVLATTLPPSPIGGVQLIDLLPNDGAIRYYKSRHMDEFGNYSAFTAYSEALTPAPIAGAGSTGPMAAFGAIVDAMPPSTKYEMRMAASYADPDAADGMQSYIDFPATTNFMRIGQTPKLVEAAVTFGGLIKITVTAHGYATGDVVTIRGHLGVTAANGTWVITVTDADHFTLNGSTFAGTDTPNTGHCVKLSLTIDSVGNLVVYAVIRATQLIVNGVAVFNGLFSALAGALFRNSLQHSTTGAYGDTVMNRVMLKDNNVELRGDAGTGTDVLSALLGSHVVSTSGTLTARSSKDVGLAAGSKGWTDPDGTDDGKNELTVPRGNTNTILDTKRLWCKLGDPTNDGDNVDAYDDNYVITFRMQVDFTDSGHDSDCQATVVIEKSIDSGGAWADLPGTYTIDNLGTGLVTQTFTPTVQVTGAPTHVWFRLKLSVSTIGLPGTPTGTGRVLCFSSTYRTNNYAVTWTTSSGTSKARRGLKLPATTDGTDKMPHAYLEPVTVTPVAANTAKGEVWVEDVSTGVALAYKDATKTVLLRNLVRLLNVAYNKTTTSTGANAVVYSYVLAANQLLEAGQMLRITIGGLVGANSANPISVNFGGTVVYTQNHANGTNFWIEILIYKTGANTQSYTTIGSQDAAVKATATGTMAVTDTATITIDFRCSQAGAGTFTFRTIGIELTTAPESVG